MTARHSVNESNFYSCREWVETLHSTQVRLRGSLSLLYSALAQIEESYQRQVGALTALKDQYIARVNHLIEAATEAFNSAVEETTHNAINLEHIPQTDIARWIWTADSRPQEDAIPLFRTIIRELTLDEIGELFAVGVNPAFDSLAAWKVEPAEDQRAIQRKQLETLKTAVVALEEKANDSDYVIIGLEDEVKRLKNSTESLLSEILKREVLSQEIVAVALKIQSLEKAQSVADISRRSEFPPKSEVFPEERSAAKGLKQPLGNALRAENREEAKATGPRPLEMELLDSESRYLYSLGIEGTKEKRIAGSRHHRQSSGGGKEMGILDPERFDDKPKVDRGMKASPRSKLPKVRQSPPTSPKIGNFGSLENCRKREYHRSMTIAEADMFAPSLRLEFLESMDTIRREDARQSIESESAGTRESLSATKPVWKAKRQDPRCNSCSIVLTSADSAFQCPNSCLCKLCSIEHVLAREETCCGYCYTPFARTVIEVMRLSAKKCHVCGIALPLNGFAPGAFCAVCLRCITISGSTGTCVTCKKATFHVSLQLAEKVRTTRIEQACCYYAEEDLLHSVLPCGHKICKVHAMTLRICRVCRVRISN